MADVLVINVSKDGPTTSIQEAVRLVKNYIDSVTSIDGDLRINIGDGTYAGFTLPDGLTSPLLGSVYRLKIGAAGSYFPILDFNNTTDTFPIGIDLGTNNPNVDISNLRIQYFAVGIRALANCHELKVSKSIISNNRNAGIFVEHSDDTQFIQNIVVNGDYGIVSRLCRNTALIHNTIFLNGAISTTTGTSVSAVWCEAGHNYGGGITDTGKIHLIGNIITNTAGYAVTLFYDDIENNAVVSNYNVITLGAPTKYINLEDRVFYRNSSSSRRRFNSLAEWKTTGLDLQSISSNPGFIKPVKDAFNRTVHYIDLNLISTSSALGLVPSFYVNATATALWLPSYVDSAELARDILNNNRETRGTAAGCNDRSSNSGFYGQDIFTNPLTLGTKECGKDPLEDILQSKIQKWFPKINKGYFYSSDREYYLYAKKECKYIGELAVTEFITPGVIALNKPIQVYVAGTRIEDDTYFDIVGNKIILYHRDLNIVSLDEELHIECYIRNWGSSNGFSYEEVTYRFKIKEGTTRYLLPKEYVGSSPVVITDDMSSTNDPDQFSNREFTIDLNTQYNRPELVFNNTRNYVINGQFDYGYGEAPTLWESSNASVIYPTGYIKSCYGDYLCSVSGSGYIEQLIPIDSNPVCVSFHHKGEANTHYSLDFIDHNFAKMGYIVTGSVTNSDSWVRSYFAIGATGDSKTGDIPENTYTLNNLGYYSLPDDPSYALLKYYTTGNSVYLDGIKVEKGTKPSLYSKHFFLDELTVEYETSEEDSYINKAQSLSPLRTHFSDGFLYIPEICSSSFAEANTRDPNVTTLHEYRWPNGRKLIMPWARTLGKDKLRYRANSMFHRVPTSKAPLTARALNANNPKEIVITPNQPTCVQGDAAGVGFAIQCIDEVGNPVNNLAYMAAISTEGGRYPGALFKTVLGLKEQLNQTILSRLDNYGSSSLTWIPPDYPTGIIVTKTPIPGFVTSVGKYLSFVYTKYELTEETIGSVTVQKEDGSFINLEDSLVHKEYFPTYQEGNSVVSISRNIKQGTVSIWVEGKQFLENFSPFISTEQFYIDYDESKIYVKGRFESILVEFTPLNYTIDLADPFKIVFDHNKVFGSYSGNIVVGYDYKVDLLVEVEIPGYGYYISKPFKLLAKNSTQTNKNIYNSIALEI